MTKIIPNTFMCFNAYIDRAMHQLSDSELRVLVFSTRHILGWQDKIDSRRGCISLSMFVNGFESTDEDGAISVYSGCGLGEAAVRAACKSLCQLKFLIKIGAPTEKGQEWQLGAAPDWVALEGRTADQLAKRKQQVEKATAAALAKRNGVTSNDTPSTLNDTPLSSDDTPPVTSNVGEGVTSNDEQQSHVQSHVQSHESTGRRHDPFFDAISWAWNNQSGGYVGKLRKFLTGKCVKADGDYFQSQITEPMTPREIVAFRLWREHGEATMPKIPATINRLVEEFRGVPEYERILSSADKVLERLGKPAEPPAPPTPAPEIEPIEIHDTDAILDALAVKLGG